MVDCIGLENRRTERYRGFESLSLRKEKGSYLTSFFVFISKMINPILRLFCGILKYIEAVVIGRLSRNLVGISINQSKSVQEEFLPFYSDYPSTCLLT